MLTSKCTNEACCDAALMNFENFFDKSKKDDKDVGIDEKL